MSARTVLSLLLVIGIGGAAARGAWLAGLKGLLQGCPVRSVKVEPNTSTPAHGFVRTLSECVRRRTLMAIDRMLEDDVVPIFDGLELVRFVGPSQRTADRPVNSSVDHHVRKSLERTHDGGEDGSWREKVGSRLARVFRTHVIRIDVDRLREKSAPDQVEARGRRRRKHQMSMLPIVMMGMILMGSVLTPMAFQFLAVLGGKALILAKMALMMSSIQGLKRIAQSGINYGLYHTGVPEPWHERSVHQLELPIEAPGYNHQGLPDSVNALPPGPYFGHFSRRSTGRLAS